jgi:hypothetical protein
MTALTATFSTVNSQNSRKAVGRMRPTISSGAWLVPASIACTRSSVGSTIGRKSVQRSSANRARRLSSVSDSSSAGAERSNDTPLRSSSPSGLVSPSMMCCMNAPPLTGSSPSTYARSSCAERPTTGWGTNAWRVVGIPLARATERARRANTWVWTATVGTR